MSRHRFLWILGFTLFLVFGAYVTRQAVVASSTHPDALADYHGDDATYAAETKPESASKSETALSLPERIEVLESKLRTLDARLQLVETKLAPVVKPPQKASEIPKPTASKNDVSPNPSPAVSYVGNKSSLKFHKATCEWAQKIGAGNRIKLSSREEALKQGYVACKVCRP